MDSTGPVPPPAAAAATATGQTPTRPTALAPPPAVAPPAAVTSPYYQWSAFDQELIDTVLFSNLPSSNPLLSLGGTSNGRATRLPMGTGLLSPSEAMRSGILAPPLSFVPTEPVIEAAASAIAASVPFADAFERLASPAPSSYDVLSAAESSDGSQTPSSTTSAKPKRKRRYNATSRAKHREVQRRFIVRKKEKMEQEKQLAFQMEKQVQLHTLKTEADALERERSSLLQQCVASGVDLDSHDMGVFLEEEMETLSQYYKPLHAHESSGIMQQTLRYIDGFCPDEAFLDDGKTLGGWTQQSRVEHKTISFRMRKEFPEALAAQVFERTGYSLATKTFFPRFFGAGVVIKTRLLQVMDLNTVVIYRAIYHPVTKEISRSVDILCRVQRGDSYLVLLQSLEGLNIQNYVGTHDTWTRGVVWCQISPQHGRDQGCTIQWTGCVGQCPVESLEHWSNDLRYLVLRYEGLVIAPLVTLTIQDDEQSTTTTTPGTKRPRDDKDDEGKASVAPSKQSKH